MSSCCGYIYGSSLDDLVRTVIKRPPHPSLNIPNRDLERGVETASRSPLFQIATKKRLWIAVYEGMIQ